MVATSTIDIGVFSLTPPPSIAGIDLLDGLLRARYERQLRVERFLTRQLVSFQSSKKQPFYRWYKYKEGFAASLVDYLLETGGITSGKILDPFAGAGTTLFASRDRGLDADGIELLPIGRKVIETRLQVATSVSAEDITFIRNWIAEKPWRMVDDAPPLNELKITRGAYPQETFVRISQYLALSRKQSTRIAAILDFALLCILEDVSYTRKDGQYLRWDYRSGRKIGAKAFDKGQIRPFDDAIEEKLQQIASDLDGEIDQQELFKRNLPGRVKLFPGSCLDILSGLQANSYSAVVTSPPYCNRYDYTRTYALELAALGVNQEELSDLRQAMLSCTVENRPKDLAALPGQWKIGIAAADRQELLQAILEFLDKERSENRLNNSGIARMVRGYFYEMSCTIADLHRVLEPGGKLFMVNDNVRYAGVSISVDLILSDIASAIGFEIEQILVLPIGKGNSSQQMGVHGRDQLRKCIYVWAKKGKSNR